MGIGLNKTRRNSNWEQRPLSHYQVGAFLFMMILIQIALAIITSFVAFCNFLLGYSINIKRKPFQGLELSEMMKLKLKMVSFFLTKKLTRDDSHNSVDEMNTVYR